MLGIRDWDEAPRRGHAAGEASRRDRCGIKKTCRGRVFLMALDNSARPWAEYVTHFRQ